MERERGEDRGLGGGVVALDVGGRVGLGVAERLRLLDRLVEVEALGRHLVEHVVGGAVDDAEHARHAVARERLAHRADDRDGAGDGGLEVQVDAGRVGRRVERRAVLREQRLVGGDDGRAAARSRAAAGVRAGSMPPMTSTTTSARSTSDSASVGQQRPVDDGVALGVDVAHRDPDQLERRADPGGEVVGLRREQPHDLRADDAAAEDGDAQGRVGGHGRGHGTASGRIGRERPQDRGASAGRRAARSGRWSAGSAGRSGGASALVEREQVVLGLAAHEHARRRRRRPRPPAGAGRGCSWTPSTARRRPSRRPRAGRPRARRRAAAPRARRCRRSRSACRRRARAPASALAQPADDLRVVLRAVQGRADVVAHPAVDRHVGAGAAVVDPDGLDGADRVQREAGGADDRAARARSRTAAAACRGRRRVAATEAATSFAIRSGSSATSPGR